MWFLTLVMSGKTVASWGIFHLFVSWDASIQTWDSWQERPYPESGYDNFALVVFSFISLEMDGELQRYNHLTQSHIIWMSATPKCINAFVDINSC